MVIQRRGDPDGDDPAGGAPALGLAAARDRLGVGGGDQRPDRRARVAQRRAGRSLEAVGGELVEGALEGLGLALADGQLVTHRIDRAVEHRGPDISGELVGVGRPEPGAVGVTQVVELGVADRLPDQVHVSGGLFGVEVAQVRAVLGDAGLDDRG